MLNIIMNSAPSNDKKYTNFLNQSFSYSSLVAFTMLSLTEINFYLNDLLQIISDARMNIIMTIKYVVRFFFISIRL